MIPAEGTYNNQAGGREEERRKGKEGGGIAARPPAHFGTLFTRIVSPRERHLRPQRKAGFT